MSRRARLTMQRSCGSGSRGSALTILHEQMTVPAFSSNAEAFFSLVEGICQATWIPTRTAVDKARPQRQPGGLLALLARRTLGLISKYSCQRSQNAPMIQKTSTRSCSRRSSLKNSERRVARVAAFGDFARRRSGQKHRTQWEAGYRGGSIGIVRT